MGFNSPIKIYNSHRPSMPRLINGTVKKARNKKFILKCRK